MRLRRKILLGAAACVALATTAVTTTTAFAESAPPPETIVGAFGQSIVPLDIRLRTPITLGVCSGNISHGRLINWVGQVSAFRPTGAGCREVKVQLLYQRPDGVVEWAPEGRGRPGRTVESVTGSWDDKVIRTVITTTDVNGLRGRYWADPPA